jgi:hypothetical protein
MQLLVVGEISIALTDLQKGEEKAQDCDIAGYVNYPVLHKKA